jgi:phosphatidate cytidylyltransferase
MIMSLFACLSLRELLNIRTKDRHIPIEIELLQYILVVFFTMNNYNSVLDYYLVDYRLLAALILIDFIPLILVNDKKVYSLLDALYMIGSTLFIGITFNLITQFRSYNIDYVTYIFLIAFFTDTFAYITGKLIGTRKFFPSISPKKTLEGAVGGTFMGTFIPTLFYISVIKTSLPIYAIFVITFLLSLLGQIGDLIFSFIKREFGKKDFSNIVIGNGGILDVVDSIIFITLGFILFSTVL